MRTVVLYARSPEWRAVVERADELMASPDFRVLKSEARTRAGFIDVPGAGPAFIKRVEVSSWSRGLYARVRGSRAARSLAGAAMLKAHGLAHPEPLAAMDMYQAGAVRASYLVSRALINADSLSRFMLGPGRNQGTRRASSQTNLRHRRGANPPPPRVGALHARPARDQHYGRGKPGRRLQCVPYRPRGLPPRCKGFVGSQSSEPGASRSQHRTIFVPCGAPRFSLFLPRPSARPMRPRAKWSRKSKQRARLSIAANAVGTPAPERVVAPLAGGTP